MLRADGMGRRPARAVHRGPYPFVVTYVTGDGTYVIGDVT